MYRRTLVSAGEVGTALSGGPGPAADIRTMAAHTSLSPAFRGSPTQLLMPEPFSQSPSHNKRNGAFHTSMLSLLLCLLPGMPLLRDGCHTSAHLPITSARSLFPLTLSSGKLILPLLPQPWVLHLFCSLVIGSQYCVCPRPAPHPDYDVPEGKQQASSSAKHPPPPNPDPIPANLLALSVLGSASLQMLREQWVGEEVNE